MTIPNPNEFPSLTVVFDGLNTHVNELLLKASTSPDLLNVDLNPISVAKKRTGIIGYDNSPITHLGDSIDDLTVSVDDEAVITMNAISTTSHVFVDGDYVRLADIVDPVDGASGWELLNGVDYTIETIDSDSFYLIDSDGARVLATGYTDISGTGNGTVLLRSVCEMFAVLFKMSDTSAVAYSYNGGKLRAIGTANLGAAWTDVYCPWLTVDGPGHTVAYYTEENGAADDPDNFEYKKECLYLTDKNNAPMIMLGDAGPTSVTSQALASVDDDGGPGYRVEVVTSAAHGFSDGDLVTFDDIVDFDWAPIMNGKTFIVDATYGGLGTATKFALLTGDMDEFTASSLGPATSGNVYIQSVYSGQAIMWPRGVYSDTDPVRGYPGRWVNPDAVTETAPWPPSGITRDWPTRTAYFGHGLESRMFAYGFSLDPDRIDYSELGAPYNFLKATPYWVTADYDPTLSDEANAPTSPAVDGGFFYASRGDGDRVVAVRELMGFVVVFKTNKTILYTGEIGEFFRVAKTYPVGAISDSSVVNVGNDLYFWSFDGPRRLSTTDAAADLLEGSVSIGVIEKVNELSSGSFNKVIARHERRNQRIIWHFPSSGVSRNNSCLVYYYPTMDDGDGRWSLFDGGYTEMIETYELENPVTNDTTTYGASNVINTVFEMNTGYSDDGADVDYRYVTRWMDAGTPTIKKRALQLLAMYTEEGVGDSRIYIGWDYYDTWYELAYVKSSYGASGGLWNFGTWWDTGDDTVWSSATKQISILGAFGVGRIFRFKIEDLSSLPSGLSGLIVSLSQKGPR